MNETCKTSLRFIDGKPAPAFCMDESGFERSMYKDYGYTTMIPKDDVESITKQDLIDHPEKFKPFKYSICTGFHIKYKHLKDLIKYINGKWEWVSRMKCAANPRTKTITKDVIYMELHYPKYYKKLITKNGLPETYSQIKESGYIDSSEKQIDIGNSNESAKGKTHHVATPIITPEQVNAEINYTHISESSDLKL